MLNVRSSTICNVLLLAITALGYAEATTGQGAPLLTRFSVETDSYPENFSVVQGHDGLIYVTNLDGITIFDRERWQVISLPDNEIAMGLSIDNNGQVVVGGGNRFGYLEHSLPGQPRFVDLSGEFSEQLKGRKFYVIFDVAITDQGYFYLGRNDLFFFDPKSGQTRHWYHAKGFTNMTVHQQQLWLNWKEQGLKKLQNGEFVPVEDTGSLAKMAIHWISGIDDDRLLVKSESDALQIFQSGQLQTLDFEAGFPPAGAFSARLKLSDHQYALGTLGGEVYVVDLNSMEYQRFVLANENIQHLAMDHGSGGIFVLTNTELIRLDWPSQWSLYDDRHGLAGAITDLIQTDEQTLVASSAGLFASAPDRPDQFEQVNVSPYESWGLAKTPHAIIYADLFSFYSLQDGVTRKLSENERRPRMLETSRFDDETVFFGTRYSIGVIKSTVDSTQVISEFEFPRLMVSGIAEAAPGHLFVTTLNHGVYEIVLNSDFTAIQKSKVHTRDDGLQYQGREDSLISVIDDRIHVTTNAGVFKLDQGAFSRADFGNLPEIIDISDDVMFEQGPDGTIWAFGLKELAYRHPHSDWRKVLISDYHRGAINNVSFGPDQSVWIGTNGQLFRHQGPISENKPDSHRVSMRSVLLEQQSKEAERLDPDAPAQIPAGSFTITFEFALPWFQGPRKPQYQTRLLGLESDWSDWNDLAISRYNGLATGSYQFQVRAITSDAIVSAITDYPFEVSPEWYQRTTTKGLLLLFTIMFGALISAGFLRYRLHQLRSKNKLLDELVRHRTAELEAANHQLKNLADSDGLTGIANRRRLDRTLEIFWSRCMAAKTPLALVMLDLDEFKAFNDSHGHLAGDQVLKTLGALLTEMTPDYGICGRYGGEEFAILLPGQDKSKAAQLAESIRIRVSETLELTASLGVAAIHPNRSATPNTLISQADKMLYEAKLQGRNQVVC